MKDDLIKVKKYLDSTNDIEARIALTRLIAVIEAWRSNGKQRKA